MFVALLPKCMVPLHKGPWPPHLCQERRRAEKLFVYHGRSAQQVLYVQSIDWTNGLRCFVGGWVGVRLRLRGSVRVCVCL